jgi:hypothetical protein
MQARLSRRGSGVRKSLQSAEGLQSAEVSRAVRVFDILALANAVVQQEPTILKDNKMEADCFSTTEQHEAGQETQKRHKGRWPCVISPEVPVQNCAGDDTFVISPELTAITPPLLKVKVIRNLHPACARSCRGQ